MCIYVYEHRGHKVIRNKKLFKITKSRELKNVLWLKKKEICAIFENIRNSECLIYYKLYT